MVEIDLARRGETGKMTLRDTAEGKREALHWL